MSRQTKRQFINRWIDRTPYLLMGMAGCIFLLLIVSPIFASKKLDKTITLAPEQTQVFGPVDIPTQLFGTARVEVEATMSKQRWATYEVQLLDKDNKILVAGIKNAWRETGTWYEDGESGTWDEQDKNSGFDLRLRKAEPVSIAVTLVEVSDNKGRAVSEVVPLRVTAYTGTIETTPLWFACISLVILGVMRAGK
ncbi:hypothetical protein IQ266_26380 [filamentous cyanobacterium LEGE 11480]|uniref:Uncharacterized protein n=1 Tax=Romeriopsis navalis LEGE 11480 TaxID=2777977 RepID=A0A928VUE4_9CYAN|nr:hypothetical protein [Romeriopsis navalis]MBE9033266.1 hypothetical protein [Romeriopsis navalis LEGE 11480]